MKRKFLVLSIVFICCVFGVLIVGDSEEVFSPNNGDTHSEAALPIIKASPKIGSATPQNSKAFSHDESVVGYETAEKLVNEFVSYPQLTEYHSEIDAKKVNSLIENTAMSFLEWINPGGVSNDNSLKYELLTSNKEFLSIMFFGSCFSAGSAHPVNVQWSLNVDLKTSKAMRLSDFYVVDSEFVSSFLALEYLSGYPLKKDAEIAFQSIYLPREKAEKVKAVQDADSHSFGAGGDSVYSAYTPDGLRIVVSATYAMGSNVTFYVPYEELAKYKK